MTNTDDIEIGLDDLLFWVIWAVTFFAVTGFIAGVLYPFYT